MFIMKLGNKKEICQNREIKQISKNNNAITLIALIITVIVLLILAGVTLSLTLGERGIFRVAKGASKNYLNAQAEEEIGLNKFDKEVANVINGVGSNLRNNTTSRRITRKWSRYSLWNTSKKAK